MNKPIVGLTTYPASATHGWHTPVLYVEAVLRAGGVPMMLSGQCLDCAERWLDVVDAVVLIGGVTSILPSLAALATKRYTT